MKKLSVLFFLLVISGMTLACKDVNNNKPDKVKTGKAVKGIDDKLTVTPRSDGLLIQLNAKEEWKHISFCVRDVTNKDADEWHEKIEVEVPITTTSKSVKGELLFPFISCGLFIHHLMGQGTVLCPWSPVPAGGNAANCFSMRSRMSPVKYSGPVTFITGPKDRIRITISVRSDRSYRRVTR